MLLHIIEKCDGKILMDILGATFMLLDLSKNCTTQYNNYCSQLTTEDVDTAPAVAAGALPGLLVVQAAHLSSVALLLTIQAGHSHDPSAGLNFWDSNDYKARL